MIRAVVPALLLLASAAPAAGAGEVRALLAPVSEAVLASDLAARIESIPFSNGERFRKGDALVSFDCAAYRAALAEARAVQQGTQHSVENARQLANLKSAGRLEVNLAEAEAEKARARVEAARVPVERCVIKAPFNGRVVERRAQPYESVSPGQPLLAVLDDSQLEIRMVIPSAWLRWIKAGAPFSLLVDETGRAYPAKVARLGAKVDAVSQSVGVVGLLDGKADGIMAGMSGSATFAVPVQ